MNSRVTYEELRGDAIEHDGASELVLYGSVAFTSERPRAFARA